MKKLCFKRVPNDKIFVLLEDNKIVCDDYFDSVGKIKRVISFLENEYDKNNILFNLKHLSKNIINYKEKYKNEDIIIDRKPIL
jgi:hypothetical protein